LLIGLVGATGCGKTTLAELLVQKNGFEKMHMGQPIKDMLIALGLSQEQVAGTPEERNRPSKLLGGRSPRYAMQSLGTNWGREMIDPNIWASAVEIRLRAALATSSNRIVIDDLRFPNDWRVVTALGGVIVRVTRVGASKPRSHIDKIVFRFPILRDLIESMGGAPIHETEYHWHDAPASIDLANDEQVDITRLKLVDCLKLDRDCER
jgi:hypothetical protein